MEKILIFSGTTEGRHLAESLAANGIYSDVSVATEYGSQVMEESPYINILEGRLDIQAMKALYQSNNYKAVVDATHPFATEVTKNIQSSLEGSAIPYFRLLRDNDGHPENIAASIIYYKNLRDCVSFIKKTKGKILLTTGSKELALFAEEKELRDRLIVRVLPGLESLKACIDAGLEGRQIIAMQGPFSKEMNLAQIREYDIRHLVSKESGHTGGLDSKIEAAGAAGIACHIIRRPDTELSTGLNHSEVLDRLAKLLNRELKAKKNVMITLAGIGMGKPSGQTYEVAEAIAKADLIFGAARIIDGIQTKAKKYPYYLEKDIRPVIKEAAEHTDNLRAVILFSGDSGFYSGCKKIYESLRKSDYEIEILPGLSSLAVMAAKIGSDYQDTKIISAHGVDSKVWEDKLNKALVEEEKIFLLTSGLADVKKIANSLKESDKWEIYVGYNLSYDDEKVVKLRSSDCMKLKKEGLYVVFLIAGELCS